MSLIHCNKCELGYIDFGNCPQCEGNPCEKEVRTDEKAKVIDEVENGLTKLMIMAEENKSLSFSKGHYDLVFTVLADFLDISETRIEEKWKQLKEQK